MERVDVLVVGGGLVGCASAWHLARSGARVTLLEAGEIGMGASGQNAGSLHFQLERRFLENGEALAEQASRTAVLSRLAIAEWRGLETELGADLHVEMHGGFMVAQSEEEVRVLEKKAAREAREGIATQLLDGDEARRRAPYLAPSVCAASFLADEGHADARATTNAFANAARSAGAKILTRTRVDTLAAQSGGFVVECGPRRFRADQLLLAAGAWTTSLCTLLNLHMPLFPVGLVMNASQRSAPFVPHLIQHVGRRLSLKQTHTGNILIGGGWPSRMALDAQGRFDPAARAQIITHNLHANMRAAVETVPKVADLALIRSWTGVTAISADQLPIVGQVPSMPGCWVAAGGSAFTLGPTFARLLTQEMAGQRQAELDIVSPARFEHLNSFMGAA